MEKMNELHGTILKGVGGLYGVRPDPMEGAPEETILCSARGQFRHAGITPLPGDAVVLSLQPEAGEDACRIREILPRKNSLVRPAIANLTHLFVVVPAARPKPDLLTADKLISAAEDKGIEPVILITKTDLDPESAGAIRQIYETGGFSVFPVSSVTGAGVGALSRFMEAAGETGHMTAAFAGVSGAGKSTLMSALFPALRLKTGEVSRKIARGRHTTRHAELYPVKCGQSVCFIADTPGFSMLDFARAHSISAADLPYTFREFVSCMGQCRYTKCTHTKEEGCAVLAKMEAGDVARERHAHYCAILSEIRQNPEWKRRQEHK